MKDPDAEKFAYEAWVRNFAGDLYRCAARLCGEAHVAEELVQETYYHAWRSRRSLRDPARARGWLLQILRFRYTHWLRDRSRRPKTTPFTDAVTESLCAGSAEPADAVARSESLQKALGALDDRYKEPFLLVFLEGMTCQEVGEAMKIPLGTVLSRIHRARQFLREHLERDRDAEPATLKIYTESRRTEEHRSGSGDVA